MKIKIVITLEFDDKDDRFRGQAAAKAGRIIRGVGSDLLMAKSLRPQHQTLHSKNTKLGTLEITHAEE